MASIRRQLRLRLVISISLLLVTCSGAIWLWARYLAGRQVEALLNRDVQRLTEAVVWNPDLEAFELRSQRGALARDLVSRHWLVTDAAGHVIWTSPGSAPVAEGKAASQAAQSRFFSFREQATSREFYGTARPFTRPRLPAGRIMLDDFPGPVTRTAREVAHGGQILATELEFEDDRLVYEVTVRRGDDLINFDMDGRGQVLDQSIHRVPTELPGAVLNTLAHDVPGASVTSFDWRASQGHLQFIVNANAPDGRPIRRCIRSTGEPVPLYFPDDRRGTEPVAFRALVFDPQQWRRDLLEHLGLLLAAVCTAGVGATLVLSEWLTRRTVGPIARIAGAAGRIDDRRLSDRLSMDQPDDEIGQLIGAINGMLNRIETAFERQRRFARDASHELRGPLTGLIAQLELGRGDLPAGHPTARHLSLALERSQRLRDLLDKLLLLARLDSDQPLNLRDDVELRECLTNVSEDFTEEQRHRIELHVADDGHDGGFVQANEELLHSMFRNIVENALKFSPAGSPVVVRLVTGKDGYSVEVSDRGPGIPPAVRDQVFQPFVRLAGSSSIEGAGLGLSIVRWIADVHAARLRIGAGPDGMGTCFAVDLPSSPVEARAGA